MKCDAMRVFHIHRALTNYIFSHCMMFHTIRKKKCYPFFCHKAQFVWFSQFMQKRWPGTGSSPKTACSHSVKETRKEQDTYLMNHFCVDVGQECLVSGIERTGEHEVLPQKNAKLISQVVELVRLIHLKYSKYNTLSLTADQR